MRTPKEFDYDLWTTKENRCMVRVKATGVECEVSLEIFRLLRAEEKRVRRSSQGIPVGKSKGETEIRMAMLSLDFVSIEGGEGMESAWLEASQKNGGLYRGQNTDRRFCAGIDTHTI